MSEFRDTRPEIILAVDYGYKWPMSTIFWGVKNAPDWQEILPEKLYNDLEDWARFFNKHADHETRLFGSEEIRRHFDLEGVRLWNELDALVGHKFKFVLELWF